MYIVYYVVYFLEQYPQDVKDHLEWLRHNIQPWSRVLSSWEITSKARIQQLRIREKGKNRKRSNIHDYTTEYPALNTLTGYSLVYHLLLSICYVVNTFILLTLILCFIIHNYFFTSFI